MVRTVAYGLLLFFSDFASIARGFSSSPGVHHRRLQQQRQTHLSAICSSSRPIQPSKISSFVSTHQRMPPRNLRNIELRLGSDNNEKVDNDVDTEPSSSSPSWLPTTVLALAGAGVVETAYLTWSKLSGTSATNALCGSDGSCGSVLTGPYSSIPGTEIPLAAVGLVAYGTVVVLGLNMLSEPKESNILGNMNDGVVLTALTTAMAVFSLFLMSLLFGVLQQSCTFCIVSACLSTALAVLSWSTLPDDSMSEARRLSSDGGLASFCAAVLLYFGGSTIPDRPSSEPSFADIGGGSTSGVLVAKAAENEGKVFSPPPINTKSSRRALELSSQLRAANAKMYGAYWCSHCFEQKEAFGKQAMKNIQYIECSKDGFNSQSALCKQEDVPGYPTWQIDGKLYPGQQELDELEDILKGIKTGATE